MIDVPVDLSPEVHSHSSSRRIFPLARISGVDLQIPVINIHGQMTGVKLRLQPAMTEWMMGFPAGWTELPYPPANTAKKD